MLRRLLLILATTLLGGSLVSCSFCAWNYPANHIGKIRTLANNGGAHAQYVLGDLYAGGLSLPKDEVEALKWYRRAAAQGDVDALRRLGYLYRDGEGVPKNAAEAAKWFRRAADQGDPSAQDVLSLLYAKGKGVKKDEAEAYKWHLLAGTTGDPAPRENYVALSRDLSPELRAEGEKRAKAFKPTKQK